MTIFVYPGSFDPVTKGHMDIIDRASRICDKLIVAVLVNDQKSPVFSMEERMNLLRMAIGDKKQIEVQSFNGLLIHFMESVRSSTIVKGLRAVSDFENEMQMAMMNKQINPDVETLFMMTSAQYSFLSSSVVRELAKHGGPIEDFVPEEIVSVVKEKYQKMTESMAFESHENNGYVSGEGLR